ncbi:MAG: non-canonical purine NTP pyrophosphatase [Oligoflexia bacterium]|nr:non-canonical purine NTP pyrophosphatase [Oligoflexia bacterium]
MNDNRSILFITGNAGKLAELRALYPRVESLNIELPELQSLDPHEVIQAKLKAAEALGHQDVLVEDTSLCCECLGRLPGPLIKWFLAELGPSGLAQLVHKYQRHAALARTVFGLSSAGRHIFGLGEVRGNIVAPRGKGFGWDSIFQPLGSSQTFGEMETSQKASFSMRTLAFYDLRRQL